MNRIRNNLTGLAFVVGLTVASGALWYTGVLEDTWVAIQDAKRLPLALVVLVGMASPIVHAWRWQIVMRSLDVPLSLGEACDISVSSALLNYSSPGFVGASAKAVLANQTRSVSYSTSALAIGFEYLLDLSMMATSAAIVILIIGPSTFRDAAAPLEKFASAGIAIAALAIVAILAAIAWKLGAIERLRSLAKSARRVSSQVNRFAVGGLTLLYWLLQVVVVALMFWALGIPVILIDVLAIATVPGIAGMLAPLPGGVGVKEAVTIALTTVIGVGAVTLLTLALVQRVLLIAALPLSLGIVRLVRRVSVRFA